MDSSSSAPSTASMPPTPEPPHGRMPLEQRAKIFISFDPLKGFQDALRAKEEQLESRHPDMHAFCRNEGNGGAWPDDEA